MQQLNASEGFAILGSPGLLHSFGSDVVGGDVNQDGYADLLISATFQDVGDSLRHGAVYVLYGNAEGFPATVALPQK